MVASIRERNAWRTGRVVRTVHTGSSGAMVQIIERLDGSMVAVKTAYRPRVSAAAQAQARAGIEPFFGQRLPAVVFAGTDRGMDTLVAECPATTTLADAGCDGDVDEQFVAVWHDVVATLTHVWTTSALPGYAPELATRNHHRRVRRGRDGLDFATERLGLPLAVEASS